MKYQIYDRYNPITEALDVLYVVYNKIKLNENKWLYKNLNEEDMILYTRMFKNIKKSIKMKQNCKKFFEQIGQEHFCNIANMMINSFIGEEDLYRDDYQSLILTQWESYSLEAFPKFIMYSFGLELLDDQAPLIDSIELLDISDQEKLSLLSVFFHFKENLSLLCEVIDETVLILKEEYKIFDSYFAHFKDKWEEKIVNQEMTFALKNLGFHVMDYEYVLIPRVILGSSLVLSSLKRNPSLMVVYVGCFLKQLTYSEQTKENQYKEALKVLSDSSKLDILMFIKDKPAYGQEIANHLKLRTSTISYHMDALTSVGFIQMKRENNRIYYQMNKEHIQEFIKDLEKTLLK